MVTILIADDDFITVKNIFNDIMKNNKDIKVVGITNNGTEVLKYMDEYLPDILLLDIMMPKMSGIELLEKLIENKEKYLKKTKIIVISGYISDIYINKQFREYIYAVLQKPYDKETLTEVIKEISDEDNIFVLRQYINNELNKFNFNKNSNAYKYLEDTIYLILVQHKHNFELENEIYIEIAKMYSKKNEKIIKWAIEKLMNNMYINTRYEIVKDYFNFQEDKKPTTKLFIRKVVDNCYLQYMKEDDL